MENTSTKDLSGNWKGWFCYGTSKARHSMELKLSIRGSNLSGQGIDSIGNFILDHGDYHNGGFTWTKIYDREHFDVRYEGVFKKKRLSGTWTIGPWYTGRFMLRPHDRSS